jgi:rubrerythrin
MEKKIKAIIQQAIDDTMSSRELYLTLADLVERPDTKETLRWVIRDF